MESHSAPPSERWSRPSPSASDEIMDPVLWMWGSVFLLSAADGCEMGVQFGQSVGITLLSGFKLAGFFFFVSGVALTCSAEIIFVFLFCVTGCESSGQTTINPVTSIGMFFYFCFILFIFLTRGRKYISSRVWCG